MKVSIITVCFNSADTIRDTLESVRCQNHVDIEHILIDGGSTDATCTIISQFPHVAVFLSEKDKGMYNAMNKGIALATGDIVGILNSDDFFSSHTAVADIVSAFEENNCEAVFGDIAFVSPTDLQKKIRHYSSRSFNIRSFQYGFMPPHPTFYVKRSCYERFGLYQEDYVIASDYELIMRFLYTHRISYSYIPKELVYMRPGGVSNQTFYSRFLLNKEIIRACNENGVRTGYLLLSLKYIKKSTEYIRPFILNIFSRRKA